MSKEGPTSHSTADSTSSTSSTTVSAAMMKREERKYLTLAEPGPHDVQSSLQNASITASKIQRHSVLAPEPSMYHPRPAGQTGDHSMMLSSRFRVLANSSLYGFHILRPAQSAFDASAPKADIETKTIDGGITHHMISSMYCCCTCMTSSNDGLSHCTTCIGCPTARARK